MLWRISAFLGGTGGLASLLLPYVVVTGGVFGAPVHRKTYTLFELAGLLDTVGRNPELAYILAFVVVVGSTMALVGAFAQGTIAFVGGLVQAGAAGAFAYALTTKGSRTFAWGLAHVVAEFEMGFFLLVGASAFSVVAGPLKFITESG